MKKNIIISVIILTTVFQCFSQSYDQNFVKSVTYKTPGAVYSTNTLDVIDDAITTINYFDGLGRQSQTVNYKASPLEFDVVTPVEYDDFGRIINTYMSYPLDEDNSGIFVSSAISDQQTFFNNYFQYNTNPYSTTEYDNSPLNIVKSETLPGTSSARELDPAIHYEILYTNDIIKWEVNSDNQLFYSSATYPENLTVKHTTDPDGNETWEYSDIKGNIVSVKSEFTDDNYTYTYYVYDDLNNLRFVLSPMFIEKADIANNKIFGCDDMLIKQYCYYYKYNERKLVTIKQIPGTEPINLSYDNKDQLRYSQDGKQREDNPNLRTFYNYDKLGRITNTGFGYFAETGHIDGNTEITPGEGKYNAFYYYDNYSFSEEIFLRELAFNENLAYENESREIIYPFERVRGLQTASKTRVLNDETEQWIYSVTYYDEFYRAIQTVTLNHLKDIQINSNKYDFNGNITKTKDVYFKKDNYIFIEYSYVYDNSFRLEDVTMNYNDEQSFVLESYQYNELGEMTQKNIYETTVDEFLQSIDFKYDIRSSLTDINDVKNLNSSDDYSSSIDLFAEKIYYDQVNEEIGNTSLKNGNISAIQWASPNYQHYQQQSYLFSYDNLNRMTDAVYSNGERYNEEVSYDLNGNITSLNRNGQFVKKIVSGKNLQTLYHYGPIDQLSFSYIGNQVISINDEISNISSKLNNDFRDNGSVDCTEYSYDLNGNMLTDANKGISIKYNFLNLPEMITFDSGDKIIYLYDASGNKLQSQTIPAKGVADVTDYCGTYIFENSKLSNILTVNGRLSILSIEDSYSENINGIFNQTQRSILRKEFYLTDHLGNNRIVFTKDAEGNAIPMQEQSYYPFGMEMNGFSYLNTTAYDNDYKYNGKELQDEFSLNLYDYGARFYDPVIGRFTTQDPAAEIYTSISPYAYVGNNPIIFIDSDGRIIKIGNNSSKALTNLAMMAVTSQGRTRIDRLISSRSTYNMTSVYWTNDSRYDPYGTTGSKSNTVYYVGSTWKYSFEGGAASSLYAMSHEFDHAYSHDKDGILAVKTRESTAVYFENYMRSVYGDGDDLRESYEKYGLSFSDNENNYNLDNEKVTDFEELVEMSFGDTYVMGFTYNISSDDNDSKTQYILSMTVNNVYAYRIFDNKNDYDDAVSRFQKLKEDEED